MMILLSILTLCTIPTLRWTSSSFAVAAEPATSIVLSTKLTNLGSITDIQHAPGDSRLFVVTREGRIRIVTDPTSSSASVLSTPFLDMSARVKSRNERGLLGLAFHPEYETNGYFFLNYIYDNSALSEATCSGTGGNAQNTRISRFTASGDTVDPTTELVFAEIEQPYCNHNGGQLQFGHSDDYLYIATGDGGSSGDPGGYASNLSSYLGKLLRVDVDTNIDEEATVTVGNPRWTIPPGNPNCQSIDSNALGEIVAYGLRNPWRFGFDRATGDVWVADVGQNAAEDVSYVPQSELLSKCHHFGWDTCEGTLLFEGSLPSGCFSCSDASCFVVPVLGYGPSSGRSLTGGYVYRGVEYAAELNGVYFYADYVSGHMWGARGSGATFTNDIEELGIMSSPTTFGEDINGELFVGSLSGTLSRIEPGSDDGGGAPTPSPDGGDVVDCPNSPLDEVIDINTDLRLSYQVVVPRNENDDAVGVFCAELVYQGEAWVALAVSNTGTMQGSVAMIGLPDEGTVVKHNMQDSAVGPESSAQTLRETSVEQSSSGTTTVKFAKVLREAGEPEIDADGSTTFLWAHGGSSNTLGAHGTQNQGSFNLILTPTTTSSCSFFLRLISLVIRFLTFGFVTIC